MNWLSFFTGAGITAVVAVALAFFGFEYVANKIIKAFFGGKTWQL